MLLEAYVNFGGYLSISCVILLLKLKLYKVITLLLYFIMMSVTVFTQDSLGGCRLCMSHHISNLITKQHCASTGLLLAAQ
jgi:hypothetical protein